MLKLLADVVKVALRYVLGLVLGFGTIYIIITLVNALT